MRLNLPKLITLDAKQAEKLLLKTGFKLVRSKGSHRIYQKGNERIIIPFHGSKILHPKITKSIIEAIED